ncbi:hypothetical protein CC117_19740 [Parafrankia colletiae]|uniref:Yqey-like protein n=1 Tax=Parafrankia colletiae TaxID=573497 RepID=A0A1S1QSU7_9ACTN|nr:hypothetical protein [Parafrankia colletiae]MCK9903428.1 GatB/YqeY domain-containing protein [Frankia sp. Cpl3]OHV35464.1 hypothetical protein CC117_19740 [Parafrankia colletiae]
MATPDVRVLRAALRDDLVAAMKARNRDAVTALRTTIAALDNAEAVAVEVPGQEQPPASGRIAGGREGLGVTEAERRELSADTVRAILRSQLSERVDEADRYDALGQAAAGDRLRREADALRKYVQE